MHGYYNKIIVRNIFDKTAYYREFTSFSNTFPSVVEPFVDAEFINDNKQLRIIYLTGSNKHEVSEIVNLY